RRRHALCHARDCKDGFKQLVCRDGEMIAARIRQLLPSSTGLTLARVAGSAAAFFTQFLLARFMEPGQLGVFYIVTSMAIILGTVAALGYPGIANRLVVRYAARGKTATRALFIRTARRDALVVSGCIAITIVAAAAICSLSSMASLWPAAIAALAIPAFAMLRVNGGLANALHRFALSFLPDNLVRPTLLLLTLACLAGVTGSLGLIPVLVTFSAITIVVAAMQAWFTGASGRDRDRQATANRREIRMWRLSGLSLVAPLLITALFADVVIMLSSTALPVQQIAVLGLCVKIAFLFGFFIQIVHQVATPRIAHALESGNSEDLRPVVTASNVIAVSAMCIAVALVSLFGERLLSVFGPQFSAGTSVLLILTCAQLARALAGPAMPLLIASGRHAGSLPVVSGSLAAFVIMLFLLVPSMGVTGASLAVLVATAISGVGLALVVRREFGVSCDAVSSALARTASSDLPERRALQRTVS
ncbi:MAG: lipopolysaccharide biosynthesis protein, partial [Pseudomonadota bacterium]